MTRTAITAALAAALTAMLAGSGLTSVGWLASAAVSAPRVAPASPRVIVVGVAGLRWDDVSPDATPALWRLAADSAVGVASVKAADPVSCPQDGWLTLGAGNRATAELGPDCTVSKVRVVATNGGATVVGLGELARRNRDRTDATQVGALSAALTAAGRCVSAAGADAALGAATAAGAVSSYRDDAVSAVGDPAFLNHCPVTLVAVTLSTVDQVVERVRTAAPGAVLLVVGVSESAPESSSESAVAHLHPAVAHGAGFSAGRLTSASTRRGSFVQLVDVAPTILAVQAIAVPAAMIGQPWRASNAGRDSVQETVADLRDLDRAARQQTRAIVPFFLAEATLLVVACGFALLLSTPRRRIGLSEVRTRRAFTIARVACAAAALVPAGSFVAGLFPCWRSTVPLAALFGATAVAVALATLLALGLDVLSGRREFGLAGAIGAITMTVIGIDLLTGGRLEIFTMNGYSPLVAGRFAGIGNVAFGVFGAAAVLAAAGLHERFGIGSVLAVGVLAVALDGASPWGSDVGGVLALVPAFAVLAFALAGVRISSSRALLSVGVAVLLVGVLGVVDYSRAPTDQTHLGRFVGQLLHGGAWTVVRRKGIADLRLLTHSALTLLVPVLVVVVVLLVRWPPGVLRRAFERASVLRPALVALLTMAVIAAVVNDSGAAIPALMILIALPAAMTVVAGRDAGEGPPKLLP